MLSSNNLFLFLWCGFFLLGFITCTDSNKVCAFPTPAVLFSTQLIFWLSNLLSNLSVFDKAETNLTSDKVDLAFSH